MFFFHKLAQFITDVLSNLHNIEWNDIALAAQAFSYDRMGEAFLFYPSSFWLKVLFDYCEFASLGRSLGNRELALEALRQGDCPGGCQAIRFANDYLADTPTGRRRKLATRRLARAGRRQPRRLARGRRRATLPGPKMATVICVLALNNNHEGATPAGSSPR